MVRSVAGNLPEQVKNNQSVNTAAGNGGQKMSQYSWFTVYFDYTESRLDFGITFASRAFVYTNAKNPIQSIELDRIFLLGLSQRP